MNVMNSDKESSYRLYLDVGLVSNSIDRHVDAIVEKGVGITQEVLSK